MKFRDANHRYWFEKTLESTRLYCEDFLQLSQCGNKKIDEEALKEYMYSVMTLEDQKRLCDVTRDDFLKVFPEDIMGRIHEYDSTKDVRPDTHPDFEPKHLMYKYAVMRDDEHGTTYEFLMEYDIFQPEVEIYYGVKAISDSWETPDDFITQACDLYENICVPLLVAKNSLKEKSVSDPDAYKRKFKVTNNANNGTYWLFWCRVESGETAVGMKKAICEFYRILSKNKHTDKNVKDKKPLYAGLEKMSYSLVNPWRELKWWFDDLGDQSMSYDKFIVFLGKMVEHEYLTVCGDAASSLSPIYKYNVSARIAQSGMTVFFYREFAERAAKGNRKEKRRTGKCNESANKRARTLPIEILRDVIQNKDGNKIECWYLDKGHIAYDDDAYGKKLKEQQAEWIKRLEELSV